jgi:hypothetical protein
MYKVVAVDPGWNRRAVGAGATVISSAGFGDTFMLRSEWSSLKILQIIGKLKDGILY